MTAAKRPSIPHTSILVRTRSLSTCLLIAVGLLPTAGAMADISAQTPEEWTVTPEEIAAARAQRLFQSDETLALTLTADFNTIRKKDRGEEKEDRPATLTYVADDGREVTLEIKLRTRGNWRLSKRNCDFPPLWLDFDKDSEELVGTVFEGQNRLKLYVTCKPGNDRYEQYILLEYSMYPVYRMLTDVGFQARLALVTYVDSSGDEDPFTRHAFILEHKSQLAARNEAVPIDLEQLHPRQADQESAALVETFLYGIGMTDYSAVFFHNIELIRTMDGRLIPVPYDGDWAGLVNARYAKPDPSLPIRNVRQRFYQGFCREVDYQAIYDRIAAVEADVNAFYTNYQELDEDNRKKAIEYLEDFFEIVNDPGKSERLGKSCRQMPM